MSPPVATVLVALFAALVAFAVARRNAFATASAKFRAAVTSVLGEVYPTPTVWPTNVDAYLRSKFPALQTAVAEFQAALPFWKRRSFERAWGQYHNAYGRPQDSQVYHHYEGFNDMPDPKLEFRRRIDALLAYAKAT
jgi:hypothetical protein